MITTGAPADAPSAEARKAQKQKEKEQERGRLVHVFRQEGFARTRRPRSFLKRGLTARLWEASG